MLIYIGWIYGQDFKISNGRSCNKIFQLNIQREFVYKSPFIFISSSSIMACKLLYFSVTICYYSLSIERLVDINVTKFYIEKVVLAHVKFEIYPSSSNIFALKLCSN
jgi:hypothetical protein